MAWQKMKIGSFLKRCKDAVEIKDNVEYKRITIKTKHQGVFVRDITKGALIGTKLQFTVKSGQFLLSKIDARLGAFGIVPEELDGAIITGNFWAFDVDKQKVNIEWFNLFTSSGNFYEICNQASSGTTHRKYLDESKFLNFELDIPDTIDQAQFIKKYNAYYGKYINLENEILAQQNYLTLLRQSILQEAVQGKLVPQDAYDEPAEQLLQRIKAEKSKLIKEGKLKKEKELPPITEEEIPFELPKGWVWCRLGNVSLKITDGTHHSPLNTANGDYKYITAKNIKDNGIDLSSITYVSSKIHEEIYNRCNPEFGDLLYIKDGATTGIVTLNSLHEPFSMLSSVALIKVPKQILNQYLLIVMRSPYYYQATRNEMAGIAITRVTLSKMISTLIPLPSLEEQKRIIEKVGQLMLSLSILEEHVHQSKINSQQLIQTLLREAFGGEQKEYAENEMLTMAAEE